ncbi:MAG: ParB/RepB/Spo0J family partition protein [Ornithinimicrobium sp.]
MNDRRRGLGRGLGALIPTEPALQGRPSDVFFSAPQTERRNSRPPEVRACEDQVAAGEAAEEIIAPSIGSDDGIAAASLQPVPGADFAEVEVLSIVPNPQQPRQHFDADELAELVASIQAVGVLQPVVVRRIDGQAASSASREYAGASYELVMGERRLRASKMAGLQTIPAIIRDTTDDSLLRDALLENLHRSQLNPLEEAAAYQQLLQDFQCTHDVLAERIGRSRPQISNTVRLLKLPGPVQRRVASGVLSAGHARALLSLPDSAAMERLAARIVAEGLSVRSVEEMVVLGADSGTTPRSPRRRSETDPDMDQWAASVSDRLDTRVSIAMGKRKGKLTVEFASKEDLARIIDLLG